MAGSKETCKTRWDTAGKLAVDNQKSNRRIPPAPVTRLIHDAQRSKPGFRQGKKIASWLAPYLSKYSSQNFHTTPCSTMNGRGHSSTAKATVNENCMEFNSHEERPFLGNFQDSASATIVSKNFKSFSHELGLGGQSEMPLAYLRVHSCDDLKELLGSLKIRFDAAKEIVNVELASFTGDIMDYLHQNNLSTRGQQMLKELLVLAQECITMTSQECWAKCEGIVLDLTVKRQLCETGLLKWLLTRFLFILTRCTRLLQLQRTTELMPEKELFTYKHCLGRRPIVEMSWESNPHSAGSEAGDALIPDNGAKIDKDQIMISAVTERSLCRFGNPAHGRKMILGRDAAVIDRKSHPRNHQIENSNVVHGCEFSSSATVMSEVNAVYASIPELQLSSDGYEAAPCDEVLCRICEEIVPAGHLESHSYICAHADKYDLKFSNVDERLYSLVEVLEKMIESRNNSLDSSCSSPNLDSQATYSASHFDICFSKMSEWSYRGVEALFEDLHEMDTAFIDDYHTSTSMNLRVPLLTELDPPGLSSTTGSMTSGSSTNTPRAAHFDIFWSEDNPSRAEDISQIIKLAAIGRCVVAIDISEEGSCERLIACMQDLQEILQNSKLQALVLDTFGGRIEILLREKYILACEQIESKDNDENLKENSKILSYITSKSRVISSVLSHSIKERTTIDDFEIIKPISRGSFGKVFLARKRTTGDLFAIKVLKKLDMIRKNNIKRLLAERNILIAVRNPFVVRFYYSFTSSDKLYLVMEYLNGGDLYSLLRKVGCLEEDVARTYAAELMLALEYLHSLGIVHRDLKPDNILVAHHGHIKLTDFGLSKLGLINSTGNLYGAERKGKNIGIPSSNSKRTEAERGHSALGTPDYLAPEILLGTDHGHAADWWSVGIILFEFITGIPPFTAESPEVIFDNILNRKIPWPDVPNEMSFEAQDLINRLLILDPNQRLGAKGSLEVKVHPFFMGVDWDNLASKKAAFVPHPDSLDDTSYFLSRYDLSFRKSIGLASGDSASETSSCSNVEIEVDADCDIAEFDSLPTDISSINFSFKNLSQLASINYDVLLGKDPTKCLSPSRALKS